MRAERWAVAAARESAFRQHEAAQGAGGEAASQGLGVGGLPPIRGGAMGGQVAGAAAAGGEVPAQMRRAESLPAEGGWLEGKRGGGADGRPGSAGRDRAGQVDPREDRLAQRRERKRAERTSQALQVVARRQGVAADQLGAEPGVQRMLAALASGADPLQDHIREREAEANPWKRLPRGRVGLAVLPSGELAAAPLVCPEMPVQRHQLQRLLHSHTAAHGAEYEAREDSGAVAWRLRRPLGTGAAPLPPVPDADLLLFGSDEPGLGADA